MKSACVSPVYRAFAKLVYFACVTTALTSPVALLATPFLDARADDYSATKELLLHRRWSEAAPALERLLVEAPTSMLIRIDLATAYLRLNERAKAITVLNAGHLSKQAKTAATAFVTEEGLKRYEEGLILLTQLKPKASIDKFERAQSLERDHLDLLVRLSENEILLNDSVDARKWLTRIEELYGLSGEALYWKSVYDLRTDPADLVTTKLDSLAKENPDNLSLTLLRLDAIARQGRKSEAVAAFDGLIKRYPKLALLPLERLALRAEIVTEPGERAPLDREARELATQLEKDPESFRLKTSEWGTRLYSPENLQKTLKTTIEKLNPSASASTY